MSVDIRGLVARVDRLYATAEDRTLDAFTSQAKVLMAQLERRFNGNYRKALREAEGKSQAWKIARAAQIYKQLEAVLKASEARMHDISTEVFQQLLAEALQEDFELIAETLNAYEPGLGDQLISFNQVNLDSAARAAERAGELLGKHTSSYRQDVKDVITKSLVEGYGASRATSLLRKRTGLLRYQAERIVRTETINISDADRRDKYQSVGLEYVQRIATQDTRICEFCAARAGNVYLISEAPASIHPNDRCYNMPWRPEWAENGVIDNDWIEQHRQETLDKLGEGEEPNHGPAPFEKKPPKPLWVPGQGYTASGNELFVSAKAPVDTIYTEKEANTIRRYARQGYDEVNQFMYDPGQAYVADAAWANGLAVDSRQLNSAIQRTPLEETTTIYHPAAIDRSRSSEEIKELLNEVFSSGAFISGYTSLEEALEQLDEVGEGQRPMVVQIDAVKGVSALRLGAVPGVPESEQNQILLGSDSHYRVLGSRLESDPTRAVGQIVRAKVQAATTAFDESAEEGYEPLPSEEAIRRAVQHKQQFNLDVIEREAITSYTGSSYVSTINSGLRGEPIDPDVGEVKQDRASVIQGYLEDAVHDGTLGVEAYLYRGAAIPRSEFDRPITEMVGEIMTDEAFMSTSLSLAEANNFLPHLPPQDADSSSDVSVLFKIRGHKDTTGLYLAPLSVYGEEKEFLMPPNTKLKVLDVQWRPSLYVDGSGYYEVETEVYEGEIEPKVKVGKSPPELAAEFDPVSTREAYDALVADPDTAYQGGNPAVDRYVRDNYSVVNGYLRGERTEREIGQEVLTQIEELRGLTQKATIPEDMILYRSFRLPAFELPASNEDAMIGTIIEEKGFSSTSLDRLLTTQFRSVPPDQTYYVPVQMTIETPEGTRGLFIGAQEDFQRGLMEVLLPPGTKYEIVDASFEEEYDPGSEEPIRYLDLRVKVVNQDVPPLKSSSNLAERRDELISLYQDEEFVDAAIEVYKSTEIDITQMMDYERMEKLFNQSQNYEFDSFQLLLNTAEKPKYLKLRDVLKVDTADQLIERVFPDLDKMALDKPNIWSKFKLNYDEFEEKLTLELMVRERNEPFGYGPTLLSIDRTIDLGEETAHHNYFRLGDVFQGSDYGERAFYSQVEQWKRMGVEEVETHANIDVGGYAWAKFGYDFKFKAERDHMISNLSSMLDQWYKEGYISEDTYTESRELLTNPLHAQDIATFEVELTEEGKRVAEDRLVAQDVIYRKDEIVTPKIGKLLMLGTDWIGVYKL